MIRCYGSPEVLKSLNWPPRLIIDMDIYEGRFEIGFNCHYSLDSDLMECCEHFFKTMKAEHPKAVIKIGRSQLNFRYCDLPKQGGES